MESDSASHSVIPVIVAPTYNNAGTVAAVVRSLLASSVPVIVVDDGCTDATPKILSDLAAAHPRQLRIVTHPRNRGKGAALQTGFAAARVQGGTHAVTIDTDGQHDPDDIPRLLEQVRRRPDAYVVGVRDVHQAGYPARSRLGRRLSNLMIRLECGRRVHDSQCGLRVYPLALIDAVKCRSGGFSFETEIITRAVWTGCPIVEVPVLCRYLPPAERISHFCPGRDTLSAAFMHLRMIFRTLAPWPHQRHFEPAVRSRRRSWRKTLAGISSPVRAWRRLRRARMGPTELAAGLAVGVFVANMPCYGFQTALGLYLARRLHLSPFPVVAGTQVSVPPVGPLLIAGAISLGHLFLHGAWLTASDFHGAHGRIHLHAGPLLLDWIVGSFVIGGVTACATFLLTGLAFRFRDRIRRNRGLPEAALAPQHAKLVLDQTKVARG